MTLNALNINNQGVVYYSTGGVPSEIDASTAGNVLTSNGTGLSPSFQAVPIPFVWNLDPVSGATFAANNGYVFVTGGGTYFLPIGSFGDIIRFIMVDNISIIIDLVTAGTTIHMGNVPGSLSLQSIGAGSALELICSSPNNWAVLSSMGNFDLT